MPSCWSCQVSARVLMTRSAIISMAVSRSRSSHSVPYGRRYLIFVSRPPPVTSCLEALPLGAESPAADRRIRIALDLDDLLVLHVDPLPAADRAVWADALDD